jgi:hypothetical protein
VSDLVRWLVCLVIGHARTEWAPATWVHLTLSDGADVEFQWTSNMSEEIRFCARCHNGYEHRYVL